MKRLGLIVNPVAGMGGRVGLKGTDGEATLRRALALGAVPAAPARARAALERLRRWSAELEIVTCPGLMGETAGTGLGMRVEVLPESGPERRKTDGAPIDTALPLPGGLGATTAADTQEAARALAALDVDLLLFAGGDGTARDIATAVGTDLPALGIPAGVKIHSAVYGTGPAVAGDLAAHYLFGPPAAVALREAEVMDIDEEAFRQDRLSARLFGSLLVPYERGLVQGAKQSGGRREDAALESIGSDVARGMLPGVLYLLGPGSTTQAILDVLGLRGTLLGVDAARDGQVVGRDLSEDEILDLLRDGGPARVVVTAIGGQGFVFGRGNQQLSPRVLRAVGVDHVVVVATRAKLLALEGRPLLVDTGESELDRQLSGYVRVVTGLRECTPYRVEAAEG